MGKLLLVSERHWSDSSIHPMVFAGLFSLRRRSLQSEETFTAFALLFWIWCNENSLDDAFAQANIQHLLSGHSSRIRNHHRSTPRRRSLLCSCSLCRSMEVAVSHSSGEKSQSCPDASRAVPRSVQHQLLSPNSISDVWRSHYLREEVQTWLFNSRTMSLGLGLVREMIGNGEQIYTHQDQRDFSCNNASLEIWPAWVEMIFLVQLGNFENHWSKLIDLD